MENECLGDWILKIFSTSPPWWGVSFLNFPPMVGGKFFQLPPQGLRLWGENFPPRVSDYGGEVFPKNHESPHHGGGTWIPVHTTTVGGNSPPQAENFGYFGGIFTFGNAFSLINSRLSSSEHVAKRAPLKASATVGRQKSQNFRLRRAGFFFPRFFSFSGNRCRRRGRAC